MKNFLVLVVNLATVAFTLAAVGTFLNYLLGWHLGYKGSELPPDPALGGVFLAIAAICGAVTFFVNRKG